MKRIIIIKLLNPVYFCASICFLFLIFCIFMNLAWSETNSLKDKDKGEPAIEEVESWGAFRGWSPEVPYGQNSTNPIDTENKNEDRQMKEENLVGNEDDQINSTVSDQSQVEIDEDESWGAFRNWSPKVPYDN